MFGHGHRLGSMGWVWMGVSALGVACDASPATGTGGAPAGASSSGKEAAVFRQAARGAERLSSLRAAARDAARLAEQPCPDDAIRASLGIGAGKLLSADYDYLERYASPKGGTPRPGETPWSFLTTPALRAVRGPLELESRSAAVDMVYRLKELSDDHPYAAVIRTTERRVPTLRGEQFVAGALSGTVVIVELESGRRLCQASFSTPTPEDIAIPAVKDRDNALLRDFTMRARAALDDAVGRITRVLTLDLG